ncbi:MAG: hypothetical protein LUQ65_04275 [Candidatus Helarchaeota archaeon]|nr:hypothetical protein [Candidatus Helarchaeota archaeon]
MQPKEEIAEIEGAISQLEQFIIKQFVDSNISLGRDPILISVLAHFYLHRDLTQKQLQDLTGYSAGAISQALKQAVQNKAIQEHKPKARGQIHYTREELPQFIARSILGIAELFLSYESEFKEIQQGLEEIPMELHSDPLYLGIRDFVSLYSKFIPVYKSIRDIIEQEGNIQ